MKTSLAIRMTAPILAVSVLLVAVGIVAAWYVHRLEEANSEVMDHYVPLARPRTSRFQHGNGAPQQHGKQRGGRPNGVEPGSSGRVRRRGRVVGRLRHRPALSPLDCPAQSAVARCCRQAE